MKRPCLDCGRPTLGSRCPEHDTGRPFAGYSETYRRLPEPTRQAVLTRDGHRCTRCGATGRLEVDHIQPQARGGTDDMSNLRTLCRPCHQKTFGWRAA